MSLVAADLPVTGLVPHSAPNSQHSQLTTWLHGGNVKLKQNAVNDLFEFVHKLKIYEDTKIFSFTQDISKFSKIARAAFEFLLRYVCVRIHTCGVNLPNFGGSKKFAQ